MAFADVGAGGFNAKPVGTIPGAAPRPSTQSSTSAAAPQPTPTTQFDAGALSDALQQHLAGMSQPGFGSNPGFSSAQESGIVGGLIGEGPYGGGTPPSQASPFAPIGFQPPGTPGGGSGGSQYQLPDFNTLLQQQLEKLGFGQLDNGLRQQQEQLMIRFGDPNLAALAGFGADPQSADFARQNYLSGNADLARLDTANKLAKQQIINQLAAHGLLFSGDTGYRLGQQDTSYGNQRYDLTNKYLDALNQMTQSVQQQKNQMRQNLVNSLLNFYSQYAANPQQLAGVLG